MNIFVFIIGIALSGIAAHPTRSSSIENAFDKTQSYEFSSDVTIEDDDLFNDNRRRLLPDLVPQIDQHLDRLFQKDTEYPPGLDVTKLQICRRKTISNYINLFNTRQLSLNDMLNGIVQGAAICRSKTAQKSGLHIQPLRCRKCIVQEIKKYISTSVTTGETELVVERQTQETSTNEFGTSKTILALRKVLEVITKFRSTIYNTNIPTNRVTDFLVVVFKAIIKHQNSLKSTGVDLQFQKVTKAIETYLWKLQQGEDASSYYTSIFNSIEFYMTRLTAVKVPAEYTETQLVFEMILNELLNFASYRVKGTADYDDTLYLRRILSLVANFNRPHGNDKYVLYFLDRMFDALIYYRDVQTTKALVKETQLNWESPLVNIFDLIATYRQNYHFESVNVEQLAQIFTESETYLKSVSSRRQHVSGSQHIFNQVLNSLVGFYRNNQDVIIRDVQPIALPDKKSGRKELQYLLELLQNHSYGSLDDEYVFQRRVFELFYKARNYVNFDSWGNSDVNKTFKVFFEVLNRYMNSKTPVSYGSSQILVIEEIYQVAQRLRFLITQIPLQQEDAWYFQRVISALISYHSRSHIEVFSTGAEVYINTIYDTIKKYYSTPNVVWEKVILEIEAIYKRSNANFVGPNFNTSTSKFWKQVFKNIIGNRRGVAEFYLQEIFQVIVSYIDNRRSDYVQVDQVLAICIKYINHRNNHPIVPIVYRPVDQTKIYMQVIEEILGVVTNFNDYDVESVDVEEKYIYQLVYKKHEKNTNITGLKLLAKLMVKIYQVIKQSRLDINARTSSLWIFNIIYNQIGLIEQNHTPAQVTVFDKILITLQKIVVVQEPSFPTIVEKILKIVEDEKYELIERIKVVLNVTSKLYLRIVNVYENRHERSREWTYVSKMLLRYSQETYGLLLQYVQQKNEIDYTVDVKVVFEAVEHILVNDNAIIKPAREVTDVIRILQKVYSDLMTGQLDVYKAYRQIVEIIGIVFYGQTIDTPTIEQWVVIIEELIKLFAQDVPAEPGTEVTLWNDVIWKEFIDIISGRGQSTATVKAAEIAYNLLSNQLVTPTFDYNTAWDVTQRLLTRRNGGVDLLIPGVSQAWSLVTNLSASSWNPFFGSLFEKVWTYINVVYNHLNFRGLYNWFYGSFFSGNWQIKMWVDKAYELYKLFYLTDTETLIGKTVVTIDQYLSDYGGLHGLKKLWGEDVVSGDISIVGGGCNGAAQYYGGGDGIVVPLVVEEPRGRLFA